MQGLRVVTSFRPTLKAKAEKGKKIKREKAKKYLALSL